MSDTNHIPQDGNAYLLKCDAPTQTSDGTNVSVLTPYNNNTHATGSLSRASSRSSIGSQTRYNELKKV